MLPAVSAAAGSHAIDDRQGQGSSVSTGSAVGLWTLNGAADPGSGVCAAQGELGSMVLSSRSHASW